jgi:hypothetical protein
MAVVSRSAALCCDGRTVGWHLAGMVLDPSDALP